MQLDKILGIALMVDTPMKLIALIVIAILVIALMIGASICVVKLCSTFIGFKEIKLDGEHGKSKINLVLR